MNVFSILLIGSSIFFPMSVFAQETEFYQDERYDFSFEVPPNWQYQEDISFIGKTIFQVLMYPSEFSLDKLDESKAGLLDLAPALAGLDFQLKSPLIGILFENIPQSEVSQLTEIKILEYVIEKIKIDTPHAKTIDSYVETHSWGWEVTSSAPW